MSVLTWFIDRVLETLDQKPQIKILVHQARFISSDPEQYYFVKVINNSHKNIATITHVWVIDSGKEIPVLKPERPLPHKLNSSDIWETWFPVNTVSDKDRVFKNVRVLLSSGKTYKSEKNSNVPPFGFVA